MVPPRAVGPTKPPRDFEQELREEMDEMVQVVAQEYIALFPTEAGAASITMEEQVCSSVAKCLVN